VAGLHGRNLPAKTISPALRAFLAGQILFASRFSTVLRPLRGAASPSPPAGSQQGRTGATLFNPKGEIIMANIGTFTAEKDGFTGTLRTLTLNVKVKLVPNDKGDNEKRPGLPPASGRPRHRRGVEEDQRGRAGLPVRDHRRSFVPGDGLCPPDRRRERHARPDLVAQQAQGGLTAAHRAAHCGGARCC
jgi:hypothetical protein